MAEGLVKAEQEDHIYKLGAPADLTQHSWYHGEVSKEEAEKRLSYLNSDCFLIRKTGDSLFLSRRFKKIFSHILIQCSPGYYKLESSIERFLSISFLISHYQVNRISTHLYDPLGDPCPKDGSIIPKDVVGQEGNIYSLGAPADLTRFTWYHGSLTQMEAVKRLEVVNTDYQFLIRESKGSLFLSRKHKKTTSHTPIECGPGWYKLAGTTKQFHSIPELITYYQLNTFSSNPKDHLGEACQKDKPFKIQWRQCADLPFGVSSPQVVRIGRNIYMGGGGVFEENRRVQICKYDSVSNKWTLLPKCPTHQFGLAQLDGDLVIAGGKDSRDPTGVYSNKVCVLQEAKSDSWEQTMIPPLPTARHLPSAFSHESNLIVAGGNISRQGSAWVATDVVEVYQSRFRQWYSTKRLPFKARSLSSCIIASQCYLLGGAPFPEDKAYDCLQSSLSSLLENAEPIHKQYSNATWDTLSQKYPNGYSAAVEYKGQLLVLGGRVPGSDTVRSDTYMLSSPSNSWVRIPGADLPVPLLKPGVAKLEEDEIIVVGGEDKHGSIVTTVFIGSFVDN